MAHTELEKPLPEDSAALSEKTVNSLNAFMGSMRGELVANHHQGKWDDWYPCRDSIMDDFEHHWKKLRTVMLSDLGSAEQSGDKLTEEVRARIREHCADCGNLLMKISREFGGPEIQH